MYFFFYSSLSLDVVCRIIWLYPFTLKIRRSHVFTRHFFTRWIRSVCTAPQTSATLQPVWCSPKRTKPIGHHWLHMPTGYHGSAREACKVSLLAQTAVSIPPSLVWWLYGDHQE
jgi:hypothetical protein